MYRPAASPMQSGRANTRRWVLEFEPQAPLFIEPLMGWTGSTDPWRQVRLSFPDKESAVRFAERQGYAYTVSEPGERRMQAKSYADNFRARAHRPTAGHR
ncbi:ETC complex I subunit [Oceaniradius stylonematis]|uniref:ETC complex I subunit n=1 Tax=Oceaniradius stylonematis TaxID=2184161 RepID=UPI0035CF02E4